MKRKLPQYIHHQMIEIQEGLEAIKAGRNMSLKKERLPVGDYMVHVTSLRLRTFLEKGVKCYICGKEATQFSLDSSSHKREAPHMNLWGMKNDGSPLLFTHDHVVDRARGGADTIDNSLPCCTDCNHQKNIIQTLELGVPDKPAIKAPRTKAFSKERYQVAEYECEIAYHRGKKAYVFSQPPVDTKWKIGHRVPTEWNVMKKD